MNRTNIVTKPSNHFNSCDDFFVLVVSCHIIAATIAMVKMKSVNDTPNEDVLPYLKQLLKQVVDSFIGFLYHGVAEYAKRVKARLFLT